MDHRLRTAVRLLGVMLLCGITAFVAGAAVPNRSVRLGNAVAETSPHDQTSLNIGLTGTASASTEASGSPASNAIDGSASTDWCSTMWTGTLTVDLGRVRSLARCLDFPIERPPFDELTRWMKAIQLRPTFAVATGAKPSALSAA